MVSHVFADRPCLRCPPLILLLFAGGDEFDPFFFQICFVCFLNFVASAMFKSLMVKVDNRIHSNSPTIQITTI